MNSKFTAVFSKIPLVSSERSTERWKVSQWLEKLHIQREKVKDDNKRQEGESRAEATKSPEAQGQEQHIKNTTLRLETDKQKVNDLVKKSNRCIMSVSSVFPWSFSRNTIEVEEGRVTFKFKQFFTSQSHSVDIKDISNVFIESSFFFATLQVVSRTYIQNDIKINNLDKTKAKKVQMLIEGLRIFSEHNINTSSYETKELISKLEELQFRDKVLTN